jgi:hypothetical protein
MKLKKIVISLILIFNMGADTIPLSTLSFLLELSVNGN